MKKNIIIFGSGGLGKETILLLEKKWNIVGFVDDYKDAEETIIGNYKVLGNINYLLNYTKEINVVIAIANPSVRQTIVNKLKENKNIVFPTIISDYSRVSKYVQIGEGTLIYANTIITVDTKIGDFNIIDDNCSIGHDVAIGNYVTIYPSSNVSGNVILEDYVEVGVGSSIIQGMQIGKETILGAGSIVVNNIPANCTAVGVPAKPIKFKLSEA